MKRHWFLRGLKFVLFAILFLVVFTFVVMRLWNWLMPALFGWHLISFWQALGLLILSKILFGGFRGGPHRHWKWRRRLILPLAIIALVGVAVHAAVDFPLQIESIQLYVATYLGLCWGSTRWDSAHSGR